MGAFSLCQDTSSGAAFIVTGDTAHQPCVWSVNSLRTGNDSYTAGEGDGRGNQAIEARRSVAGERPGVGGEWTASQSSG